MAEKFYFPLLTIDDYLHHKLPDVNYIQNWTIWIPQYDSDYPMNGPENGRIKVIGKDELLSVTLPVVKFLKAGTDGAHKTISRYELDDTDPEPLRRVSVFGTILKTISIFEDKNALGRRLKWRHGNAPLNIYPYGETELGAEYDRRRKWLKFSYFTKSNGTKVYTCASPDIVAHETAHAVLDSIAPDLIGPFPLEPHCRAIHEAVADLTAVFITLTMDSLRNLILDDADRDLLGKPSPFGWIAEDYGNALSEKKISQSLRDLYQRVKLSDLNFDATAYELSAVLSSAIFNAMLIEYQDQVDEDPESPSGKHLFSARIRISRILFRALDYLPASNLSTFSDLAEAMLISDGAEHIEEEDIRLRRTLKNLFIEHGILPADFAPKAVSEDLDSVFQDTDLNALCENRDFLLNFLKENKSKLGLPTGIRLPAYCNKREKFIYARDDKSEIIHEFVLKVSWVERLIIEEENKFISKKFGKTIVIDPNSKKVKFVLSIDENSIDDIAAADDRHKEYVLGFLSKIEESEYEKDEDNILYLKNPHHGIHEL